MRTLYAPLSAVKGLFSAAAFAGRKKKDHLKSLTLMVRAALSNPDALVNFDELTFMNG
jgi:hypothetical protein